MMWLKACPRCRGDMVMDSDYYGPSVSCIQCGYTLDKPLPDLQRKLSVTIPQVDCKEPVTARLGMSAAQDRVA